MYEAMRRAEDPRILRAESDKIRAGDERTLLELVDYVNTSAGQKIFTEPSMPVSYCIAM